MTQLGDTLKKARKEKKWSQDELADKAGVSRETISLIERGEVRPNHDTIAKLAKALDIDASSLNNAALESCVHVRRRQRSARSHAPQSEGSLKEATTRVLTRREFVAAMAMTPLAGRSGEPTAVKEAPIKSDVPVILNLDLHTTNPHAIRIIVPHIRLMTFDGKPYHAIALCDQLQLQLRSQIRITPRRRDPEVLAILARTQLERGFAFIEANEPHNYEALFRFVDEAKYYMDQAYKDDPKRWQEEYNIIHWRADLLLGIAARILFEAALVETDAQKKGIIMKILLEIRARYDKHPLKNATGTTDEVDKVWCYVDLIKLESREGKLNETYFQKSLEIIEKIPPNSRDPLSPVLPFLTYEGWARGLVRANREVPDEADSFLDLADKTAFLDTNQFQSKLTRVEAEIRRKVSGAKERLQLLKERAPSAYQLSKCRQLLSLAST
ncbi:MAG: hypothetical protein KatS3mg059_1731 [Thermomicrobiales bacterium]|nr:MAG: hypothetical protein KatS3mg059_1731 [Thermomicrobiales bacterium]